MLDRRSTKPPGGRTDMLTPATPRRTYRDYLPARPGFPLPFADRAQPYAEAQRSKREANELARRIEGSRHCG